MSRTVTDLGLNATQIILILRIVLSGHGVFLETLSMMVGTIPIVMPVILHLELSRWFGIFLVIMMEPALITPPVG